MNNQEKEKLIKGWLSSYKHLEKVRELSTKLMGDGGGLLIDTLYSGFAQQTHLLGLLLGDNSQWLSWFLYDNDAGRLGLEARLVGVSRKIRTVKDLLWAIERSAE